MGTPLKRSSTKTLAGIAGLLLVAVPLAACGSEDDNDASGSSSSSESSQSVDAIASVKDLTDAGTTEVTFEQGFVDALTQLKVTPSPYMGATFADGTISFPITGGNVSLFEKGSVPNYVIGQIQHENSGLNLTAGGTEVTVGNFNVDPGVSIAYGDVAVDGKVAATSIPIFRLDGSTLNEPQMEGGDLILQGTTVYLTDGAATLLNDTFGIDDLTGEIPVGIAKITVAAG